MATREEKFVKESEQLAFDVRRKEILAHNLSHYQASFENAKTRYFNLDNSKKKGHLIKWKAIENIERCLLDFESNFTKRGGKVIWANTAEEALEELHKIISARQVTSIAKAHATIMEEIGLPDYLTKIGIDIVESDLGRYITLLEKSRPSHVINAAVHLGLEDIARLFHDQKGTPLESSSQELLKNATETLREQALFCSIAITGANYIISDTGSIVLAENEGNNRLISAFATTHIVLAGINKVLPSINDLDLFLPLASSHDHGLQTTAHATLLNGPRKESEIDGPEEMIVILIDNGRTNLLAHKEQRQGLYWMECGASSNACSIYRTIGGHAYQTVYPGPMGAVFTPYLTNKMEEYRYLSHASNFTKENSQPNPLHIDIDRLLLLNRQEYVKNNLVSNGELKQWKWYTRFAKSRKLLDFLGVGLKNLLLKIFLKKSWGNKREFPKITEKSFAKQWQAKRKEEQ